MGNQKQLPAIVGSRGCGHFYGTGDSARMIEPIPECVSDAKQGKGFLGPTIRGGRASGAKAAVGPTHDRRSGLLGIPCAAHHDQSACFEQVTMVTARPCLAHWPAGVTSFSRIVSRQRVVVVGSAMHLDPSSKCAGGSLFWGAAATPCDNSGVGGFLTLEMWWWHKGNFEIMFLWTGALSNRQHLISYPSWLQSNDSSALCGLRFHLVRSGARRSGRRIFPTEKATASQQPSRRYSGARFPGCRSASPAEIVGKQAEQFGQKPSRAQHCNLATLSLRNLP